MRSLSSTARHGGPRLRRGAALGTALALGVAGAVVVVGAGNSASAADLVVRIDAGSTTTYRDSAGRTWAADRYFSGGKAARLSSGAGAGTLRSLTRDAAMYETVRHGTPSFRYAIPVAKPGVYTVRLYWAELAHDAAGWRVFSVDAENRRIMQSLDLNRAPGFGRPLVMELPVRIDDGILSLRFPAAQADNPQISGIEVIGRGLAPNPSATATRPPTATPRPTASAQRPPATNPPGSTTGVQARSADSFVDSIGVAAHLTYGDTKYGDKALIKRALADAGIRHVRDGWGCGSLDAVNFVKNELAPLGVKVTMVHDPRNNGTPEQLKECHKSQGLTAHMAGVEGPNEFDLSSNWPLMRDWAKRLAAAYRADPATRHIPTLCPSFADTNSTAKYQALGDLSAYCDFGNTHDYPGDQFVMNDSIVDTVKKNWAIVTPGKPIMATETGSSDGSCDAGHPPTPEAAAGVHMPRIHLEHFRRGLARTFTYELLDQRDTCQFEDSFGLVRNDGTYKPAFTSIRSMISLLSDKGPGFTPGKLDYTLTGGDAATRSLLLQKRDGTFWLAVWQQTKVWDGTRMVDPGSRSLTLNLPAAAGVRTYSPTRTGTTAQSTATGVRTVNMSSSAHVTLVEIRR